MAQARDAAEIAAIARFWGLREDAAAEFSAAVDLLFSGELYSRDPVCNARLDAMMDEVKRAGRAIRRRRDRFAEGTRRIIRRIEAVEEGGEPK